MELVYTVNGTQIFFVEGQYVHHSANLSYIYNLVHFISFKKTVLLPKRNVSAILVVLLDPLTINRVL